MDLSEVCDIIELPAEVKTAVLASGRLPEVMQAERHKAMLHDRTKWVEGVSAVATILGEDPDGMKMLAFMLLRAAETQAIYAAKAVDERIFADTMKFCTRFVIDHHDTYGTYAFVWGWWFPRQLSFQEFRIGTLEYELIETDGTRSISIHIPGDATLTSDALRRSYFDARATIARIAPDFADAEMVCDSWMLSPVLRDLLPATSKILAFQESFDILKVDPANRHATRWIFGRDDLPIEDLPERTSLQRNTKALLRDGGNIGSAMGRLRNEPWSASRDGP